MKKVDKSQKHYSNWKKAGRKITEFNHPTYEKFIMMMKAYWWSPGDRVEELQDE